MKIKFISLSVFVCGAATMILELLGSRMLAPYVGASIFVWTNLIGVVLAFLSLGYLWGGKLADEEADPRTYSRVILFSAVWLGLLAFVCDPVLAWNSLLIRDIRLAALINTILLLGAPSFLLGMIPPYAAKLGLVSIEHTGRNTGNIYALSTAGSLAGTFLTGFVLLSFFSNQSILLILGVVLAVTSLLVSGCNRKAKSLLAVVFFVFSFLPDASAALFGGHGFADVNTPYNRVWIYDLPIGGPARVRMMQINDEWASLHFLDSDELVSRYARYYRLAAHFSPGLKKVLMLGGAGYSYPQDFLRCNPQGRIDVVEIDPGVTELARKYFGLTNGPRLRVVHEDARMYLNRNFIQYDVIYGDVFRSTMIPFHLTTEECFRRVHGSLSDQGVLMINLISSLEGPNGRFLKGELATLKKIFPQVYVFATRDPQDRQGVQNLMVVALKSARTPSWRNPDEELQDYLGSLCKTPDLEGAPIFKDSFAPVEFYSLGILDAAANPKNPRAIYWGARLDPNQKD